MKIAECSIQAALTRRVRDRLEVPPIGNWKNVDGYIRNLSRRRVPRKVDHPVIGRLKKQELRIARGLLVMDFEAGIRRVVESIGDDERLAGSIWSCYRKDDDSLLLFWYVTKASGKEAF